MNKIENEILIGERTKYASRNTTFINCTFKDGESPLKESRNIEVFNSSFNWKYPLWYCQDVIVDNTVWNETGRSGVWYTKRINITNSKILAPKQFRRCEDVLLDNVTIPNALETMWSCTNVTIKNTNICGDYFGMNSSNIVLYNVNIDGNYCFDGGKNIVAKNCVFNSKDSFWNCENVLIEDSKLIGEYLAWNTKKIRLVRCEIESDQGLCYIDDLTLEDCSMHNTYLSFELCSNIYAKINTKIDSIKNPISGKIICKGYDELILDEKVINPNNTIIEVEKDV